MRPLVIVDAANVVGSVPDGWWRDRVGATRRLRDALVPIASRGLDERGQDERGQDERGQDERGQDERGQDERGPDAPGGPGPTGSVDVLLVVEGAARGIESVPGVRVLDAPGSGDDAIVDLVAAEGDDRKVYVVTADRGLRERVERLGARILGPRSVPRR